MHTTIRLSVCRRCPLNPFHPLVDQFGHVQTAFLRGIFPPLPNFGFDPD